ncbi:hypothetical protein QZH41_020037 [Actinostola sp. cb2023]|nr:hypothetical protein QZH41_020037 [Actinostola sp. cb2023]
MAEALGSKQKKRRFKEPQTLEETKMVVGQSIPKTTQYKTRWGVRIFENWRSQRNNKLPECEVNPLGLNVSFVQTLDTPLTSMTKASLNFWLIKFIQELTDKDGAAYVEKTMYQIICCLKRYFETNGRADLNPLDTKDVVFQGFSQILDAEMKKSHRAGGQLERCKEEKKARY